MLKKDIVNWLLEAYPGTITETDELIEIVHQPNSDIQNNPHISILWKRKEEAIPPLLQNIGFYEEFSCASLFSKMIEFCALNDFRGSSSLGGFRGQTSIETLQMFSSHFDQSNLLEIAEPVIPFLNNWSIEHYLRGASGKIYCWDYEENRMTRSYYESYFDILKEWVDMIVHDSDVDYSKKILDPL